MAATSTTYNAAFYGVLQGAHANRKALPASMVIGSTTLLLTAAAIAQQFHDAIVTPINAAHQGVLTAIVAGFYTNSIPTGPLSVANLALLVSEYTAWIVPITLS
jgi:hypothetical protein